MSRETIRKHLEDDIPEFNFINGVEKPPIKQNVIDNVVKQLERVEKGDIDKNDLKQALVAVARKPINESQIESIVHATLS